MNHPIVQSREAVTLIAAGPCGARDLRLALKRAPRLIAIDGGADRALSLGQMPEAVIGDLDSLSAEARQRLAGRLIHIPEQETTDFDKALRSVAAPFVLAVGVAGGRLDHELAVLSGILRHRAGPAAAMPCIIIGAQDIILAPPARLDLRLRPGDRLSLFPMAKVTGRSTGLEWPIDGLELCPTWRIGTSNRVTAAQVRLEFDAPGMLLILPRARLDAALRALGC